MNLWDSLQGTLSVKLTSADPAAALEAMGSAGIILRNVVMQDELTVTFEILRRHEKLLWALAERRGDTAVITGRRGIFWGWKALLHRPVLLVGMAILLILGCYLPTRIFFFRVEGNTYIPTRLILEEASACGIRFGAERRAVRSERMKNALLEKIPQLQWAGINTNGCTAVISVREHPVSEKVPPEGSVSSIVALRDGVIRECTVTKGSAVCHVGQAVSKGDVLISGFTDCGTSITATRAEGEVYALTKQHISAETPKEYEKRGMKASTRKKYSLIIGKKRINFYQDSGNLDASCVKIYDEYVLTLPGGFALPVVLVRETWTFYESEPELLTPEEANRILSEFSRRYLLDHMIAGEILCQQGVLHPEEGHFLLSTDYACTEMIGAERSEEIIKPDE